MSKLALIGLIVFAAVLEPPAMKRINVTPEPSIEQVTEYTEVTLPSLGSTTEVEAYKQEAEQYKAEVAKLQGLLAEKESIIKGLEQQLEEFSKQVVYKATEPKQVPTQQVRSYTYSNCSSSNCSSGYGRGRVFGGFFRRR